MSRIDGRPATRQSTPLRLLVGVLATIVLLGGVLAPAATAAPGDYALVSSFGAFSNPVAVGVDQETGDSYVIENTVFTTGAPSTVQRFDADGNPKPFSSTGGNELLGSATPAGAFYFGDVSQVAIDRSGGPADGSIYVTDSQNGVVDIFSQSGAYVGQLPTDSACGVAVDPSGRVYASGYGLVKRYTPSGPVVAAADADGQLNAASGDCSMAVDSTGSVVMARLGGGTVTRYAASDFGMSEPAGVQIAPAGTAVAIDPLTDDVLVDEGTQVSRYDASGLKLATFGAGDIGSSPGVAAVGTGPDVLVVDASTGKVLRFGIPEPGPPVAVALPATDLRPTRATIRGTVDAQVDATSWHFEYGTDTDYGTSVPVPDGTLPDDYGPKPVSADLSGLQPATTYHYRVVATNSFGGSVSEDQTFRTAPAAPVTVSDVGATGADLHGVVDPAGARATFHFEYGTDPTYGTATPETGAGTATGDKPVMARIAKLQPSTEYHVRLVSTTPNGTFFSDDVTFTTLPAPTVTVGEATGVGVTTATVNGSIDTHGVAGGTYRFLVEGTTNAYGGASAAAAIPEGAGAHAVSASFADLPPGGTYSVVLAVTAAGTTVHGDAVTFSTGQAPTAPPPPPITRAPQYGCVAPRLNPIKGRVAPGSELTVTGSDLGIDGDVRIGSAPAEVVSYAATAIRLKVPDGAKGSLSVTVNCGTVSNAVTVATGSVSSPRLKASAKVSGTRARVTATLPGRGTISVRGSGLVGASKPIGKAGKATVGVRLTAASRKALGKARSKRITRRATVRFTPVGGTARTAKVVLTFVRR